MNFLKDVIMNYEIHRDGMNENKHERERDVSIVYGYLGSSHFFHEIIYD